MKSNPQKRHKLLIVEDDRSICRAMEFRLAKDNYDIVIAHDGEEGIGKLAEQVPDLILLDLILPKLNGFELLKRLRENLETAAVPVIVLSNLSQKDDIEHAMKLGAIDFFVKSNITIDEMARTVRKFIENKSK